MPGQGIPRQGVPGRFPPGTDRGRWAPGTGLPGGPGSPFGPGTLVPRGRPGPVPVDNGTPLGQLSVERLVADSPTESVVRQSGAYRSIGSPSNFQPFGAPSAAPLERDGADRVDLFEPDRERTGNRDLAEAADTTADTADETGTEDTGQRSTSGRHHRARAEAGAGTRPSSAKRAKGGRRRRPTFWRELPMLIVVALLLTFLIQTFLARVYEIPSGSMETTLHGCTGCTNDRVLVDKLSYRFGDPSPGDVIVFRGPPSWEDGADLAKPSSNVLVRGFQTVGSLVGLAPPDEKDLIKRVIAVGGQTVVCCDAQNRVTVDGKPLNEPYIYYLPEAGPPVQTEFGPVKVPDGQLWVMGDSRNNSADSRVPGHGPIPVANVIGKARFVVLPLSRIKSIDDTNPQRVALSAPSGIPSGAPLALGVIGAVPLTTGRRWWRLVRRRRTPRQAGPDTVG